MKNKNNRTNVKWLKVFYLFGPLVLYYIFELVSLSQYLVTHKQIRDYNLRLFSYVNRDQNRYLQYLKMQGCMTEDNELIAEIKQARIGKGQDELYLNFINLINANVFRKVVIRNPDDFRNFKLHIERNKGDIKDLESLGDEQKILGYPLFREQTLSEYWEDRSLIIAGFSILLFFTPFVLNSIYSKIIHFLSGGNKNAASEQVDMPEFQIPLIEFVEAYREQVKSEKKISKINYLSEILMQRLSGEIDSLSRRAQVNLAIGAITSIIAIFLLFLGTITIAGEIQDWESLAKFAPRLTLVIFLETFSFFFLRLYRESLMEIKYYQNELTNIQFKIIAIDLQNSDASFSELIINNLIGTERNFVLKKDESTINLEKIKLYESSDRQLGKILLELLNRFGSNK